MSPMAVVPRIVSYPRATSARCRPCGARPLIDQSLALAVRLGRWSSLSCSLFHHLTKSSKTPLSATALIRTTVWARLVPSRLTGFGCSCQSTRMDPCPSTTPGPEPGREGYTQVLNQQTSKPLRGGALCWPSRLPTPRCEPRAAVLTRQYILGQVGIVNASRKPVVRKERLRCRTQGVASSTVTVLVVLMVSVQLPSSLRSPFPLDWLRPGGWGFPIGLPFPSHLFMKDRRPP